MYGIPLVRSSTCTTTRVKALRSGRYYRSVKDQAASITNVYSERYTTISSKSTIELIRRIFQKEEMLADFFRFILRIHGPLQYHCKSKDMLTKYLFCPFWADKDNEKKNF